MISRSVRATQRLNRLSISPMDNEGSCKARIRLSSSSNSSAVGITHGMSFFLFLLRILLSLTPIEEQFWPCSTKEMSASSSKLTIGGGRWPSQERVAWNKAKASDFEGVDISALCWSTNGEETRPKGHVKPAKKKPLPNPIQQGHIQRTVQQQNDQNVKIQRTEHPQHHWNHH